MTLLFMDGFDHYATADLTKKGWASTGAIAATGRRSGGAFQIPSGSVSNTRNIGSNEATLIVGVAFQAAGLPVSGYADFLQFRDVGTVQVSLAVGADGSLRVYRNSDSGTALVTSAVGVITAGAFFYVEFKATISDASGIAVVRINGNTTPVINGSSLDTKQTANAYANQLTLIRLAAAGGAHIFDDLYLCNTSGSAPTNDFLGDCRVDVLFPNADGTSTSFTPSTGTDHYALVDETTPNTSDYVESSTAGHQDSYQMGNLSTATGTIYGVQASVAALKDDAGARSLKVGVRSSSTDSLSAGSALSTSQLYYLKVQETDPATAAAWTESGVNAAQLKVENV